MDKNRWFDDPKFDRSLFWVIFRKWTEKKLGHMALRLPINILIYLTKFTYYLSTMFLVGMFHYSGLIWIRKEGWAIELASYQTLHSFSIIKVVSSVPITVCLLQPYPHHTRAASYPTIVKVIIRIVGKLRIRKNYIKRFILIKREGVQNIRGRKDSYIWDEISNI